MRDYENRQDRQKKVHYSDRFILPSKVLHEDVKSDDIFNKEVEKLGKSIKILESYIELKQLVIWVEKDDIVKTLKALKKDSYVFLSDLSAVDFLAKKGGFEVFYQLLSLKKRKRIRVKCFVKEKETLQSVEGLFHSANWSEREMYDMFGIISLNHPNLKRIIMPDDWHGHPLLKSYPLQGDEEARWYEIDKIFGKEYREVVGEEQRDPSRTDENDTINFARIGHEVPYNMPPSKEKTIQEYQEENGVKIVKKIKKGEGKIIEGRR